MSDLAKELETIKAELEATKTELKAAKTEAKTAKTEATKATNKLAEVQKELDALKESAAPASSEELQELREENDALKLEVQSQADTISKLQGDKNRKQNDELTDDELKEKALRIMKQKELQEAFITTKKGFVFDKEDLAKNNSKGQYKIAQLVEGKVILKNPTK